MSWNSRSNHTFTLRFMDELHPSHVDLLHVHVCAPLLSLRWWTSAEDHHHHTGELVLLLLTVTLQSSVSRLLVSDSQILCSRKLGSQTCQIPGCQATPSLLNLQMIGWQLLIGWNGQRGGASCISCTMMSLEQEEEMLVILHVKFIPVPQFCIIIIYRQLGKLMKTCLIFQRCETRDDSEFSGEVKFTKIILC